MKIGMNLLLWTTHATPEHEPILRDIKASGYDGVEIPLFEGDIAHYQRLGGLLDRLGLERTGITVMPSLDKNPIGADKAQQNAALDYIKWAIDCTAALGGSNLAGPLHSTLGHFSGTGSTPEERKRAIAFHRAAGDHAAKQNVTVTVEALNRFECYFITTMAELASHLDAVGHPNIAAMYDTFHANIEERDPVAAIGQIAKYLRHVHISENDRGVPGRGHVPWAATYKALRKLNYDGWLTIEAFGRAMPELTAATRVWRDLSPTPEAVYREGIANIRSGWAAAA